MKTIYESDELKITKYTKQFRVIDKISDHWFRLNFFGYFHDEHDNKINPWIFCKRYPTVVPILVDLGELKKWENGFKIKDVDRTCYFDMQMIHRIIKFNDGTTYYDKYGKQHRIDAPAVEYADGGKQWWINDKLHRMDGPATEYAAGGKEWYINGKRHRTDGPAMEYANGGKQWWINGNEITKEDVEQWVAENNYTVPFDRPTQAKFILTFAG